MRALIIETAFVGDVIVSLGLPNEIKRLMPSSFVSYLVRPEAADIVRACPDVDEVITFDKYGSEGGHSGALAKAEELNSKNFDVVFALHASPRTQLLVSHLTAARKIGFEGMRQAGLTHAVPDSGWSSRYERAILPLTAILHEARNSALPRLQCGVHPRVTGFVSQFEHTVALAPDSVWATKKWGDMKFASLARLLEKKGIGIIIIGGRDARSAADAIVAAAGTDMTLDLTGRASYVESGAAISASSLLVANDSAPAHLAVAVGTHVLAIFGPTVQAFGFAPPKGRGEVIEISNLWCRPCTSHGSPECPIHTHQCMEQTSVEMVLGHILRRLATPVASS